MTKLSFSNYVDLALIYAAVFAPIVLVAYVLESIAH
jgi:hypothetical protein